jgi:hypothetical protein
VLRFKALTDRARAERGSVAIQHAVMDDLVSQSVERPTWDPELARTLFELLLPNGFKDHAADRRAIELVLDEDAAAYPWELLEDPRARGGPPAIETGLVRRLIGSSPGHPADLATGDFALVVGNPQPIDADLPDLPGATAEAVAVREVLARYGVDVTASIGQRGTEALKALYGKGPGASRGYRILHLAGHGVHRTPEQGGSGMVIGAGQLFGGAEVERLRRVPELVFINCCHLGRVDGHRYRRGVPFHRLAANLGRVFIERGVRAVVAAGWAVNDAAAELFARVFYETMLERGMAFGDAVRTARCEVWERYHDQNNTWGAYQCYGDHSFVLRVRGERMRAPNRASFSSPTQALVELENIASDAELASFRGHAGLTDSLAEVEGRIPEAWLGDHMSLQAALGKAHALLGDFDGAIRHLEGLGGAMPADFPLRSLELLANACVRSAFLGWRAGTLEREAALARIDAAMCSIADLRRLGETTERHSLMGSAYKRLAAIEAPDLARGGELVDHARLWYTRAVEADRRGQGYPLVNVLYVLAAQKWRDPGYRHVAEEGWTRRKAAASYGYLAARVREMVRRRPTDREIGFFGALLSAEFELVEQVWQGGVDADAFVMRFGEAWLRGGSIRAYRSTDENLDCLRRILEAAPNGDGPAAGVQVALELDRIRAALGAVVDAEP